MNDKCTETIKMIPPDQLSQYSVEQDIHNEQDIVNYLKGQARDEKVEHLEKIKKEVIIGETFEIWDVTTDKNRWWVITNLTNLYSQEHFPSLDYVISFHIGLMMRLRSRPNSADAHEPTPFDEVFRRQEQVKERYESSIEAEDFQSVGMQLRECLLSLITAIRTHIDIDENIQKPQKSNYVEWSEILINSLCGGRSNKILRQHLKSLSKDTWQLVNWLTHHTNADKTSASIAIHSCDTVVGHFFQLLEKDKREEIDKCPVCKSREIRSHFEISIEPDGEYFSSCSICDWDNHP